MIKFKLILYVFAVYINAHDAVIENSHLNNVAQLIIQ